VKIFVLYSCLISIVVTVFIVSYHQDVFTRQIETVEEPVGKEEPVNMIYGFEEVTGAKNGQRVTVTAWIDEKFLCQDISEIQREVCTTVFVGPRPNGAAGKMIIRLNVCSGERPTNCIVYEKYPRGWVDLRDVFVYDNEGNTIDFIGRVWVEPPDTLMRISPKRLKLTGKVTVIDGQGGLIEPIEKIEAE
jgi:hypothetical protein